MKNFAAARSPANSAPLTKLGNPLSPSPPQTLTYPHILPLLVTDLLVRCPTFGSALTSPWEDPEMWECR